MNPTAIPELAFPPENAQQVLNLITAALIVFGLVWLVTSIIGAMHRRAYNLTHAESGGNKKIQPDFLKVDKAKREAAIARGEKFDEALAKREAPPPSAVGTVWTWSRILASASMVIGLLFTIITTMQRINSTEQAIRDLTNWEALRMIIEKNQLGAALCFAVIAANAYPVVKKLMKPGAE